jgi:ABC-type nitrate/sulfonate/bicarbonate transport system substrate-binding protein
VSRNYFNLPFWIGLHRGLFAAEGVDVALELHEPIDAVTERLRDGRVEVACGVTEHVILDAEAGGELEIVAGNINKPPFSLIAAPGTRGIEGLRGKTIGVSSLDAGSSSLVMDLMLSHGLRHPEDYRLVACGPILARWEKLRTGEIDAGLQGAPLDYIAEDAGFVRVADLRTMFADFQFTSINVRRGWARENRALLVAFLRGLAHAHRWFFANRDGCTEIAVAETGITPDYARRAWDEYTAARVFPPDADASRVGVQTLIEVSGLIRALPGRRRAGAEDYIDRSYLREAKG